MTSPPNPIITLVPPFIDETPLLEKAYRFCLSAHLGMIRKAGGDPFPNHPIRVASALWYAGCDDATVAAGFLHDVVEDTPVSLQEISDAFGEEVAMLVDVVSEDKDVSSYEDRKHGHLLKVQSGDKRGGAIYCADKYVNLQDMVTAYEVEDERLEQRFKTTLDNKELHTEQQIAMLGQNDYVTSLVIYEQLQSVFSDFVALRRDPNRRRFT